MSDEYGRPTGADDFGIRGRLASSVPPPIPRTSEEETFTQEFGKLLGELMVTKRQKIALLVLQLTYREMNTIAAEIQPTDMKTLNLSDLLDTWAHKVKEEMNHVGRETESEQSQSNAERGQGKVDNRKPITEIPLGARRPPDSTRTLPDSQGSSGERVWPGSEGRGSQRSLLPTDTQRRTEATQAHAEGEEARRKET